MKAAAVRGCVSAQISWPVQQHSNTVGCNQALRSSLAGSWCPRQPNCCCLRSGGLGSSTVAGSEGADVLGSDGRAAVRDECGSASADAASSTRSGLDTDLHSRQTDCVHAEGAHNCVHRCTAVRTHRRSETRHSAKMLYATVVLPLPMLEGPETSEVRRLVAHPEPADRSASVRGAQATEEAARAAASRQDKDRMQRTSQATAARHAMLRDQNQLGRRCPCSPRDTCCLDCCQAFVGPHKTGDFPGITRTPDLRCSEAGQHCGRSVWHHKLDCDC